MIAAAHPEQPSAAPAPTRDRHRVEFILIVTAWALTGLSYASARKAGK